MIISTKSKLFILIFICLIKKSEKSLFTQSADDNYYKRFLIALIREKTSNWCTCILKLYSNIVYSCRRYKHTKKERIESDKTKPTENSQHTWRIPCKKILTILILSAWTTPCSYRDIDDLHNDGLMLDEMRVYVARDNALVTTRKKTRHASKNRSNKSRIRKTNQSLDQTAETIALWQTNWSIQVNHLLKHMLHTEART